MISEPKELKALLAKEYKERLRLRPIRPDLRKIEMRKNEIFRMKIKIAEENCNKMWTMDQLESALKDLKNNRTRDNDGMINEIFKEGAIGIDLKMALLLLFNGIKDNQVIPPLMTLANITTIYKNKGSRLDLENDRGIFILTVMNKILDRLIYVHKYDDIDKNMTDSNIGARKQRSIRDNLFIIHGIINSVVKGNEECIDIQIYDLENAFDALWL